MIYMIPEQAAVAYAVHCFCCLQKSSLVSYKFTAVVRIAHHFLKYILGRSSARNLPSTRPIVSMARVVHMNGIQVKFRQMGSFYFLEEQVPPGFPRY